MKQRIGFFGMAGLSLVLVCSAGLAQAALNWPGSQLPDFASLVEENAAAVVNISTSRKPKNNPFNDLYGSEMPDIFRHFFQQIEPFQGPQAQTSSLGSGFIIAEDGLIVTNAHVIKGADEIMIRLGDRREFKASVVGTDAGSDIALLKIQAKGLPVANIGDSDALKVGEWVMAIGSPYGFDHSATAGIVSAKGRSLPSDSYVPFIQTDVAINPGNSGGPLFNLKGEVIGVNAQIYSRTGGFMGLSFAIPMNVVMRVVSQLQEQGVVTRGWLGIVLQEVTHDLAQTFALKKPHGALVAQVVQGAPADEAGIQPGDVILSYQGEALRLGSDLPPKVSQTSPGTLAELEVIRQGKRKMIEVKIGELDQGARQASVQPAMKGESASLGLDVVSLPEAVKARYQLNFGVLVERVQAGAARSAGVQRGDVITMLNYENVTSLNQYRRLVADLPANTSVPLQVYRQGRPQFLSIRKQ